MSDLHLESIAKGAWDLIANPKGYGPWKAGQPWENREFDPLFTFEI
jgi:hypothetical protein